MEVTVQLKEDGCLCKKAHDPKLKDWAGFQVPCMICLDYEDQSCSWAEWMSLILFTWHFSIDYDSIQKWVEILFWKWENSDLLVTLAHSWMTQTTNSIIKCNTCHKFLMNNPPHINRKLQASLIITRVWLKI
jgi:hypothetical protein